MRKDGHPTWTARVCQVKGGVDGQPEMRGIHRHGPAGILLIFLRTRSNKRQESVWWLRLLVKEEGSEDGRFNITQGTMQGSAEKDKDK